MVAPIDPAKTAQSVQTLPRLLAISKDFSDINEQVKQVAHIIGLPETWAGKRQDEKHLKALQQLKPGAHSRAQWALRWILEKLKQESSDGIQARRCPQLWVLLDWTIHVASPSETEDQLFNADFLSIVEQALQENFGTDDVLQAAPSSADVHMKDLSESSETVQEEPQPSRKRKRPSSGTSTPSKRIALQLSDVGQLFGTIASTTKSIVKRAESYDDADDIDHMDRGRRVLKAESAQAARLLKLWLTALYKLMLQRSDHTILDVLLDMSSILSIWGARKPHPEDETRASAEEFSTESLLPTLILHDELSSTIGVTVPNSAIAKSSHTALHRLEDLLTVHLLGPARQAFHKAAKTAGNESEETDIPVPSQIALCLEPLRAKILSALQMQDSGEQIPKPLSRLFTGIPSILNLVLTSSPSRTPQNRTAEKPLIQTAFRALAECAGCSFEIPKFSLLDASTKTLEKLLGILSTNNVVVDTSILTDIFWYHCGVRYPRMQERRVHWSLIAALVKLDPDLFVNSSKASHASGHAEDLATFLFDRISSMSEADSMALSERADRPGVIHAPPGGTEVVLESMIFPIMRAFARNRDLLGFVSRWERQLRANLRTNNRPLQELKPLIWQEPSLELEFASIFEENLTQRQISTLFEEHIGRLNHASTEETQELEVKNAQQMDMINKILATNSLLRAMLRAIRTDETVEMLAPNLQTLFATCAALVQDKWYRFNADLATTWSILGRLVTLLWPLEWHTFPETYQTLLEAPLSQAIADVSVTRKSSDAKAVTSQARAAAFLFICTSCDCLNTVPDLYVFIRPSLHKALKALSSSRLDKRDLSAMVELFCTNFAHLLVHVEPGSCEDALLRVLSRISGLDEESASEVAPAFSAAVFNSGPILADAYAGALTKAFGDVKDKSMRTTAELASNQLYPTAMSRERRETLLDQLTNTLEACPEDAALLLSAMNRLMEISNATAKISSNGGTFFKIANVFHDNNSESRVVVRLLQDLVARTLSHLYPNRDQAQNKAYLDMFTKKLKSDWKPQRFSAARLAITRAAFLVQKDSEMIPWDQYFDLLAALVEQPSIPNSSVLEAYNEIPLEGLVNHKSIFPKVQKSLQTWVPAGLRSLPHNAKGEEDLGLLWAVWLKFQDSTDLFTVPGRLAEAVNDSLMRMRGCDNCREQQTLLSGSMKLTITPLPQEHKTEIIGSFIEQPHLILTLDILPTLIAALTDELSNDVGEESAREAQLALLPKLCKLLTSSSTTTKAFEALISSVTIMLRDKPSLTSQASIENVLTAIAILSSPRSPPLSATHARAIYARLCDIARTVLLLHRSRLGGRFHVIVPLLQNLLLCLFIPNPGRGSILPPWLKASGSDGASLGPANAAQYARLLSTLCSPTQSSVSKHKIQRATSTRPGNNDKSSLNDPVRAARDYTSHYIYPLLSSFCKFQLFGRLEPGVRDKLMPGMWEVVGTASLDRDALEAMFAGEGKGVRDVWRGVWEEWNRVGGGNGGRW